MAVIQGIASNDLPSNGIALDKLETIVRTVLVAMLRPTGRTARPAETSSTAAG